MVLSRQPVRRALDLSRFLQILTPGTPLSNSRAPLTGVSNVEFQLKGDGFLEHERALQDKGSILLEQDNGLLEPLASTVLHADLGSARCARDRALPAPGLCQSSSLRRGYHSHAVTASRSEASGSTSQPAGHQYHVNSGATTMEAAVLHEPNKRMEIELLKIPQPKVGEILIKTIACGVCHTDLHIMKGEIFFPTPAVLGHEVSGVVVDHGAGTDAITKARLPVGSRVVGAFIMPCGSCYSCNQGQEDLCEPFFAINRLKGALYDGSTRLFRASDNSPISMYSMAGLAGYCVAPASAFTPLPDNLPGPESSIMGCALFTAYGALRNAADLRAGDTVAVIGCGGVGSSVIQVARAFGAKVVVAVDVSDEKLAPMKRLGATHLVNANTQDATEVIKAATGGRGVDVAVEALGKPATFLSALGAVRDGGKAVMIGIAPAGVTAPVEITRIVRRSIGIQGSFGARTRHDLPALVDLATRGLVDVVSPVTQRFQLHDAAKAYALLDEGKIQGRAIVTIE